MWPLAILMIVVTSWLLYRYVAPESWREWQGAGLVQAFLIALYAEMYGFPLTIYMLSGFFGLEIPLLHQSGHLWATLLGYGPVGGVIEMTLGYGLIFLGLGLLIEGWRELYRAREEDRLARRSLRAGAPSAVCRHRAGAAGTADPLAHASDTGVVSRDRRRVFTPRAEGRATAGVGFPG